MAIRTLIALVCLTIVAPARAQSLDDIRFGNLHAHTSYSDGMGTPEEAWEMACNETPDLDFFAITEHNHDKADGSGDREDGLLIATDPGLYSGSAQSLIETADRLDDPGSCVTIYGQEFSTISSGNHINIFNIASVIDVPSGEFDQLANWLDANPDTLGDPPLLQFNHPRSGAGAAIDYGRDDFENEAQWMREMAPRVSLIEIFNARALKLGTNQRTHSRHSEFRYWLNLGFHLAPSVGQDNHTRNWGISTDARVAVIAPDFSRAGILDALRRRHAYATEDRNLKILFRVGDAVQGDIVPSPAIGSELPITLQISDADEPDALYRVDVYLDSPGGRPASWPVETFEFQGDRLTPFALTGVHIEEEGQYLFLRIKQSAAESEDEHLDEAEHLFEDVAWTAPIWFEDAGFHHADEHEFALRISALVPNPAGSDRDNESISLTNDGIERVHLSGWTARDLAGNFWELDPLVSIGAGESKTLLRNRAQMSLNNDGDRVELVAPDGTVVDIVSYDAVDEGELVTP